MSSQSGEFQQLFSGGWDEAGQMGEDQITRSPIRHALEFGFHPEDKEKWLKDF